jgi:hypothetical protein
MSRLSSIEKSAVRFLGLMAGMVTATATALPRDIESAVSFPSTVSDVLQEKKSTSRRTRIDFRSLRAGSQGDTPQQLTLPLPEGGNATFTLSDSGVLPPELAKRYPDILSMKGIDPYGRLLRLDTSAKGVHAIVFEEAGTWRVYPANEGEGGSLSDGEYVSSRDARPANAKALPEPMWKGLPASSASQSNGHREYRLAVAATSDYTKHFGGTVSDGLASVVETINRVNAVFERDLGIHLTLAENSDRIIFTDPAEDPYIAPAGKDYFSFARAQNAKVLRRLVGNGEFDVGHLFELSDAGGALTAVCDDDKKADAHTGLIPDSTGTPGLNQQFITTVMHELGHQFGANHTFNGCERDSDNGVEPGSGSTIMGYAGACFLSGKWPVEPNSVHNLQGMPDEYFHATNLSQVRAFLAGPGSACGLAKQGQAQSPIIANPQGKVSAYIPARTPFFLDAYAESANRHAQLTYAWEQVDTGPEQPEDAVLADDGKGPIFRSYPPISAGTRVFPKLETILGDEPLDKGEVYPTTTRELNFSLTVRDNLGAQASVSSAPRTVRVVDTGEAFAIRHPTAGLKWKQGSRRAVTWNVGGTARFPIACKSVRIDLSLDGGYSYLPQPLAVSRPNSGYATVDVPEVDRDVSSARVRVTCNDHLFFAVSPGNFSILK